MDLQTFHALITQTLSNVNEERDAAEKQYDALDLSTKVQLLYQLYAEKSAPVNVTKFLFCVIVLFQARSMCLVLLRRIFANNWEELISAVGQHLNAVKEQLLKFSVEEEDLSLRKKLTDVVAEVARNEIGFYILIHLYYWNFRR